MMETDSLKGINTLRYSDIFWRCILIMGKVACTATIRMCWSTCILGNWK